MWSRKSLVVAWHKLTADRMDIEHGLAANTMKENWLNLLEKVRKMSPSSTSYSAAARCKQVSGLTAGEHCIQVRGERRDTALNSHCIELTVITQYPVFGYDKLPREAGDHRETARQTLSPQLVSSLSYSAAA